MASYKQGGMAVVYDIESRSGSVMDAKGQTLLLLSCNSNSNMDLRSHQDDIGTPVAKVMNPHNGSVKQVIVQTNDTGFGNKLSWNYDGIVITFDPQQWEV